MLEQIIAQFCLVYGCESTRVEVLKAEPERVSIKRDSSHKLGKYRKLLMDISANPSREAALTAQESAWNPNARSRYAKGLRQFTPATGKWMARTLCKHLGSYQPYNPVWSLKCGVIYIESLQKNNKYWGGNYCFNRKVAEQEYNGGSWVIRELKRTKAWTLKAARRQCRRASWACRENYEYPQRISKLQPKYRSMGGIQCKGD